ncbi:MAG: ribonuclease HI [Gemmatimonadales bacterium]|nr:MAG: ribonuclease HI [Gemmatimonadales bacterium]
MTSTPLERPVRQSLEGPASDPNPSRAVWIHADESCLGNQFQDRASPGGAAGLVEVWTGDGWERRDYWISEPGTTNNRMALRSAIEGLSGLRYPCEVRFVSDSQYLVKGMSEWIHGWKRRGWKRKGGAIENVELWKELDREAARHKVRWEWVRGHAGHPRNEYANDLAVRAAREQDASNGLVPSGFEEWLERQREEKGRYLDEFEFTPPEV